MSKINVSTITNRTGTSGPVLSGVTTATNGFHVTSGNVGVGTDTPERLLSIKGSNAMIQLEGSGGNGKQWSIISSDDVTGAAAASGPGNFVIYDDSSGGLGDVLTLTGVGGSMGLGTQQPGAKLHVSGGNIKVDSGYGIDFSATADGAGSNQDELLDDYEFGDWAPVIKSATNTITVTDTTQSYYKYIKIGRLVKLFFSMNNATTSGTTGGVCTIGGLPFASVTDTNTRFISGDAIYYNSGFKLSGWPIYPHLAAGDTTVNFYEKGSSAAPYGSVSVSSVGSNGYFFFTIEYYTN